ncbi:MAG: signal peptide peptidase SppA [Pseudomonadota bacterium]
MAQKPNIFIRILSFLWTGVNGLRKLLHLVLLLMIFSVVISVMGSDVPTVPKKTALVVAPSGALTEQLAGTPFDRAIGEVTGDTVPQILVRDLVEAIDLAAEDDAVKIMYLRTDGVGGDMTKLRKVAAAIRRFRDSGKQVIAFGAYYSQGGYYLAAQADEVLLEPNGAVIIEGYGAYRNYYAEAIEKLSISWNVFKVGTHKSFVEPYTRNDMSEEDKGQRLALMDALWTNYKNEVEAARGLDAGTIQRLADDVDIELEKVNGNLADFALENGLVDGLATATDVRKRFIEVVGEDEDDETTFAQFGFSRYLEAKRAVNPKVEKDEVVAVVVASGSIVDGSAPPGQIGGDSTARLLRKARSDENVKAVVLRVDSGGGSAFASDVILQEIKNIQAAGKPVIASMGYVAASGGYWISMAADQIVAQENTITGSIGILGMIPTFERSLARLGIYTDGVGTTDVAGALRPDRALTPEVRSVLQQNIESGYRDFVSGVADNRGMDYDAVDAVAQGQVWIGPTALEHGLVDTIGDLEDAIEIAAESASLDADAYSVRFIEPTLSSEEQFLLNLLGGTAKMGVDITPLFPRRDGLAMIADMVDAGLLEIASYNDPMHRYAKCFCRIP